MLKSTWDSKESRPAGIPKLTDQQPAWLLLNTYLWLCNMIGEKLCLENSGKAESIHIRGDKLEIASWRTIWARSWRMGKVWLQKWEKVTRHGKPWAVPLCHLFWVIYPVHLGWSQATHAPGWTYSGEISTAQTYQGSLVAQRVKNWPATQESWVQALHREDPLEKEMATQSSILAWSIPWTEEPGELQSMGLQRVRHNWVTNRHTYTKTPDAQPGMQTQLWGAGEGNETEDGRLWASFSSLPYLLPKISLF